MPQIDQEIGSCVGFVGYPSERGFAPEGTCFFVAVREEGQAISEDFIYVVTARHLVRPLDLNGKEVHDPDSKVWLRLPRLMLPPLEVETRREEWICPSERLIDLAVLPFDFRAANNGGFLHLMPLAITGQNNILLSQERLAAAGGPIKAGDEIFIPSLFAGHIGEQRNIPVVRFGHVAAPPLEPIRVGSPRTPAFLIETKSLGGTSGAPIFLHLQPLTPRNIPRAPVDAQTGLRAVPYALVGMVIGAHSGTYQKDFAESESFSASDAQFNAGISVALPISHAIALLESEACRNYRMAALEELQRQSGFKTSATAKD